MIFTIIYIDDEKGMCEMFEDNFASDEIKVLTFTDPATGMEKIKEIKPNFVLLDYRLPNTTGDDLAALIDPKIPIAMITGDHHVKPKNNFLKIFSKPLDFDDMDKLIEELRSKAQY